MRLVDGQIRLSASDLMRFKGCAHAIALDLRRLEVGDIAPVADSDEAELLQAQGDEHELAYLEQLEANGRRVARIAKDGLTLEQSVAATLQALRDGYDVIFQGAFLEGAWGGYTDFLERVDRASTIGAFAYEVVDTKLKRSPDPKHVLQLALYSDLLTTVQGVAPLAAHLQLGDGSRYSVPIAQVASYARVARARLEAFVSERPPTRSLPISTCGLCGWRERCADEWESADSLALVAGMTRSQRDKVEAHGVTTMAALSLANERVPKLAQDTQARLVAQARLQSARRAGGPPSFELRAAEAGRGFALLPEPNDGDLFYDIEGDPYFPDGLEYLHGIWYRREDAWSFRASWAHDHDAEARAVTELIDFFVDHLTHHPGAHIYHFANYELAALRKLAAKYRTREAAMDQLQREQRFVDLYRVVTGALQASEKGYSIKDLEVFYMDKREGAVATAGASVVMYERWRETRDERLLVEIQDYNEIDCISTQKLRDWLVAEVRPHAMPWSGSATADSAAQSTVVADEDREADALRARLQPVAERLGQPVAELLFDLNYFHKREDKPAWWAIFDRLAADPDDLIDDLDCIAGLEAVDAPIQVTAQSFERTYRFPDQETKLRGGKRPCVKPADGPEDVDLRSIDLATNTLVLRKSKKKGPLPDRLHLLPPQPLRNSTLRDAIRHVTEAIIAGDNRYQAVEHLLAQAPPRLVGDVALPTMIAEGEDVVATATRTLQALDHSTIAIQGPPGTGKTFTSAVAIVALVRDGKRVAVSSNSHKAIENLLCKVAELSRADGLACRIVKKASDDGDDIGDPQITIVTDNDAPEIAGAHVVGATAWHFARYEAQRFDYLVVDEAGQVSLANIVAMARAARNIVLVGDPMQLPQPLQGLHPGRSGESSLEYFTDGARVVPPTHGIFLPLSRRMHPSVCSFISSAVYDDRLSSDDGAAAQSLASAGGLALCGARIEFVAHQGRSQSCPEEIAAIAETIDSLVGATYRDRDGIDRAIARKDILVVAPYNAQVNALAAALPGVRVGTVDRFQGQEAPICLVSMTTSSADELPRDIEFLFSLNRLNVAVSRAQALAIVFASPALLEVPCRTVDQMKLVNTLCLLREHGDRLVAEAMPGTSLNKAA